MTTQTAPNTSFSGRDELQNHWWTETEIGAWRREEIRKAMPARQSLSITKDRERLENEVSILSATRGRLTFLIVGCALAAFLVLIFSLTTTSKSGDTSLLEESIAPVSSFETPHRHA